MIACMNHFKFLLLLLLTLPAYAQELYFKPFYSFQNLPSFETYFSLQDSKGNIWVSSDAGVSRYDGNSVTHFTTKDGLVENVIFKIYEDSKGRIWFSSLSGLICFYENNSFHSISANNELKELLKGRIGHSFFVGEKDTLYFSNLGFPGILKILPENNYKKVVPFLSKEMKKNNLNIFDNPIKPREHLNTTGIATVTDSSLYLIRWKNISFSIPAKKADFNFVNVGKIAISSRDDKLYSPHGLQLSVLNRADSSVNVYYFDKEIIYVHFDKNGDLWVLCKRGGGYLYKNADLTSKPIRFLDKLSVSSVMIDREGTIWATTLEKGIFICYSKSVFAIPNQDYDQICNLQVDTNRFLASYFSKKVISVFKNDSILFDTASCTYNPEYYIYSYYQGKDYFYFCTHNGYSYVSQKKNETVPSAHIGPDVLKKFIPYNHDTVISFSTLNVIMLKGKKILSKTTAPAILNCICKLHDKTILIGSRDGNGIFELKNNRFIPYHPELKQLHIRINTIAEDKYNRLWIATDKGLICLDENKVLYEHKKQDDPLSFKINALTIDENDNVWCSNTIGLIRIQSSNNLRNLSIAVFNTNHGLPDTRIEKLEAFDNKIWCTTKGYLFYFNNNSLIKNEQPPLTQLKSISINGTGHLISDTIVVPYDQNNISVKVLSSAFKFQGAKPFLYRLEGYDDKWQFLNTGIIQYTNLDHGTYKLSVYGVNDDGRKGTTVSFTLIIRRPFWLTWWFISLIAILLIIIIIISARSWKRRIEKKERNKAAISQQLTEFKMTALRSQMNPHFIYNSIGSIQHYILKNEIDQSFNYLSKFSALIRKILNNSRNEFISLEQEISTLQLYIELEQIRFKDPFEFILTIDKELDMEVNIPTMLIQPYIENSIWHGLMPKETQGRLELILKKVDSTIHVCIKDNGVGRETGEMKKKHHISKGMSLTEQRIQTLEQTSNKKFVTTVIDLKDEQGNPIGTEVNLVIPFDE